MDLQEQINQINFLLKTHQHSGGDFSAPLRNQDMQEIGRTVLTAVATSISVVIPPKRFLRILLTWGAKSGTSDDYLTFNSDSGSNYTFINSGSAARTSQARIDIRDGANSALGGFCVIDIANNIPTIVKSVMVRTVDRITNAATSQTFYQIFGTWVNILNQITTITLTSSGATTFPIGSELVILSTKE